MDVAVLFGVQPWQMLYLDDAKRAWYEMAAIRHRNHEHQTRQDFINAIATLLGGSPAEPDNDMDVGFD